MAQLKTQNLDCGGKILIRLLFTVLILAGILGLIFILMVRALPHVAIAEISELTNAKIDVESVDFNFDGSVLIEKLVIRPDQTSPVRAPSTVGGARKQSSNGASDERRATRDEDAILKAETVYARFGIGSLLLLGPRLKEIRINDFVFNAQYDLDTGQWNIAALKINVPKDDASKLPFIHLEKGTLQYSKVSKGRAKVIAAVPIDMKFRPAEEILGGYSFDITTAESDDSGLRQDSSTRRNRLSGFWRPGRISIAGGISSEAPMYIGAAFEEAWGINFLDTELRYDQGNNYSLKLKIEDLQYTQKTAKDTFAFDSPVFLTKFGLFHALQRFFSQCRPAGKVDMELEASGNFDRLSGSTVAGKVYCKDVSICDRKFPYAIEQITGQVNFTENSVVLNNLSGRHGDAKVTFDGWSKDFGPNPRYQIQIASDNMALDKDLYDALNTKQKELWTAFSPKGLAAIDYRFSRQSQTDKKKTLAVELLDADATYRGLPYPLKRLTGKLFFDNDSITVSNVMSQTNEGRITFNGKVNAYNTDRPIYYLLIKANDISFDSTLAKTLLSKQSDFYNQFDVNGLADADITIFSPTEEPGPTSFFANMALKKTSLKANKLPQVISDISAKVIITPDSTSVKNFIGRYPNPEEHRDRGSLISLDGGIGLGAEKQPSHYHLTLNTKQAQLSDSLISLLPTPIDKMVSEWQPNGKINLSAHLNKATSEDQPNYQITVDCLSDSVNFKRFAYPLRDITGKLTITNNNMTLEDITARPLGNFQMTTNMPTIKVNGQITLADNTFSEAGFRLSASDISLDEQLMKALPTGIARSYRAMSPAGRFDLDLDNIKILKAKDGEKHIDFAGVTKLNACNFNISGTRAELDAVLKTKGLYKTSGDLSNGQVSLIADALKIKGKSINSLKADINYNQRLQNWLAENLIADCYGGKLIGKLKLERNADGALEYQLQVGFANIDLRRFLLGSKLEETPETSHTSRAPAGSALTSGTMSGALSIGARIDDSSSRVGRCRLAIRNMRVGKLSPLAKMLSVLKMKEQKDFAFDQMVIDSYLKQNKLIIEKFDLSGEAVAFYGSGWMDMPSENVHLTLTARGERLAAAEPSVMQSLAEGLGRAVVRMEVTGNVYDPKVETKTLPLVEDSLKILGTRR